MNTSNNYRVTEYDREAHEHYVDEPWVTELLLSQVSIAGPVWDPFCGFGNVVHACHAHGLDAWGSDLVHRGTPLQLKCMDFFAVEERVEASIVSNPPYARGVTERAVRHALRVATGDVAVVVNLKFLASEGRWQLFERQHPPSTVVICSSRPSMPPGSSVVRLGKAAFRNGQHDYCWLHWNAARDGQRRICWGLRPGA